MGKVAKVMVWYDNEYGYSNRMLELAQLMAGKE
jgi:glyceraldehyde 3-phosphate dehydrogenase/glyceraldehyde-3-phosphate dehydrogenase (NAD(P))